MIVGEQKPLDEIRDMIAGHKKVLIVGCGTCVTVCFAGGEKEVGILASALRMKSKLDNEAIIVHEATVQRQCEWEYLDGIRGEIGAHDLVLSLGCGIGVQAIAERFPNVRVVPGLNTSFLGLTEKQGVWAERCAACGNCILDRTAGICPIARCAKSLLNGPCGGSQGGKCEVDPQTDCAWQLIYDRLQARGELELLEEIIPPRDWSSSRDGGPRRIIREDLQFEE